MFLPDDRERLRVILIEEAKRDRRIVAAAAVGSSAHGGDRWSDLDLTFGVSADADVISVLEDWTDHMMADHGAAVLFDVRAGSTIYRVFLLPGALQVDLSFAPEAEFGSRGPRFQPIFGDWIVHPPSTAVQPSPDELLGIVVHHAVRAFISIERGAYWLAEYCIHDARDRLFELACHQHGVVSRFGRGYDALPEAWREALRATLVADVIDADLRRALVALTKVLVRELETTAVPLRRSSAMLEALVSA
jgi:hypothetical protein